MQNLEKISSSKDVGRAVASGNAYEAERAAQAVGDAVLPRAGARDDFLRVRRQFQRARPSTHPSDARRRARPPLVAGSSGSGDRGFERLEPLSRERGAVQAVAGGEASR